MSFLENQKNQVQASIHSNSFKDMRLIECVSFLVVVVVVVVVVVAVVVVVLVIGASFIQFPPEKQRHLSDGIICSQSFSCGPLGAEDDTSLCKVSEFHVTKN